MDHQGPGPPSLWGGGGGRPSLRARAPASACSVDKKGKHNDILVFHCCIVFLAPHARRQTRRVQSKV